MRGAHFVVRAAARLYTPLVLLFALSLFVARPAGGGVGFIAGLAFALALVLHALVFGAAAARQAIPSVIARAMFALGLIAVIAAVGAPGLPFASRIVEAGLFLITAGGAALVIVALAARAPTLRHEEAA